jgi:tetratricopeptide (TPR) repeat protein
MCILDPKIDRTRKVRATVIVSCFLILSLILPLSVSGVWETRAQDQKTKQEEKKKQEEMERKENALKEAQADLEKKLEMEKQAQMDLEKKLEMKKKGEKISREEKIDQTWQKIEANEKSAAALVYKALLKKGPGAGVRMAEKIEQSGGDAYYFDEKEFNTLGYKFLYDKKADEAVEVFKINVKMYPESWNVYDSLGEAYLASGEYGLAKKNYEKSIALNAENENGRAMLEKVAQAMAEEEGESVAKKK